MTERQAYTFKDAINCLREAPDDADHINLAEEAMELATTLYDVDTVTDILWSRYPRMRQLMARARTRRDSLRGSSQLPDEVLIEIIRLATPNPKIDQHTNLLSDPTLFQTLNTCSRVCKRWRSVIDGAATLWAFLSGDTGSTKVVQSAIAKSGDAPVVISYGAGKMDLPLFVGMVTPQMHRCRALWVREGNSEASKSVAISLLDTPSPNLEELHVDFPFPWTIDTDSTPQSGWTNSRFKVWALRNNMQGIKTLSLSRVTEWSTALKLANLRDLQLRHPFITAIHLIESLTEIPLLHSLVIEDPVLGGAEDDDAILRTFAVKLAFLTRIELQAVPSSFVHTTLSKITPPSLEKLIIVIDRLTKESLYFPLFSLDNVGADYRGLVHSLMEAQGSFPIPIQVGSSFQRLALSNKETRREFELSGVELCSAYDRTCFARCIRDFTRAFNPSLDPSFTLVFGPRIHFQDRFNVAGLDRLEILMEIEGVSKIEVGGRVNVADTERLYQLLSHTARGADQSQRWLLPRLAILEIEGQEDMDGALARMLKDRYAAAATAPGDVVVPMPFSMVKLVRDLGREPEPEIAAEIRSIIGEEHFCIEII